MTLKECTEDLWDTVEVRQDTDGWRYVVGPGMLRVEGWTRCRDDAEALVSKYISRLARVYFLGKKYRSQILGA